VPHSEDTPNSEVEGGTRVKFKGYLSMSSEVYGSRAPDRFLLCVLLILCTLVVLAVNAQEPIAPEVAALYTIIENGGFEEGGDTPAWWGRHPREDADGNRHARDTEVFHSGQASARIEWINPISGPNKASMQWSRYHVPVEGGADLLFSCHVRTEGVDTYRVGANFYDGDNAYLSFRGSDAPSEPGAWRYATGTIPAPAGAVKAGFVLYTKQGGTTWYDDVALLGTPSTTAMRATPVLDGRLDEACWVEGVAITTFVHQKGTGLAREPVQAWTAYDDERLYVSFRCVYPEGSVLKEAATERDGDTWLDDSVEVFLDPWHRHDDYYQFAVNCRGVVRDSHGMDKSWDSGTEAAVARDASAWTVELAIPFRDLALDLDAGSRWGINLVRNDRVTGESVTWSLGGFHNPGRFGNVSLEPDLARLVLPTVARRATQLEAKRLAVETELKAAGLVLDKAPDAFRLLSEAQAGIAALADVANEAAPSGTIEKLRARLSAAGQIVADARTAALMALFAVPEGGDGGFSVAIAGSMQKVRRSGPVLNGMIANRVKLEAARDETESFQLVVIPAGQTLQGVSVEAGLLTGEGGALAVEWHPVAYVETGKPPAYTPEYVGWWPDVLMPPKPFDVAAGERQPVWLRVTVPPDTKPGSYTGAVTVRHGGRSISVPVELRVRPFRLPRPGALATPFGLYARAVSSWYYGTTDYRKVMPIEAYAPWCEFMGKYRLTPKNVANEYHRTIKSDDGDRLDLSALMQTVAPFAQKYYPPHSFCVYRLPCPRDVQDGTTKRDPAEWMASLKQRIDEYTRLGLPHEAYVYGIDEPLPQGYPFVKKVYEMTRETAPGFPIMQTVNHTPPEELAGLVDIWCPLSARVDDPFYAERKKAGDTLWTYVCCSPKPPHANFFVDQPAIDHRMVFWQARQWGATGVLYWCICWWEGLPGPASEGPHFPDAPVQLDQAGTYTRLGTNGDGILVWPGPDMTPYPSLRLEVVRDGIEDYEYLALLERCVRKAKALPEAQRPSAAILEEAEALCTVPATISESLTDYTKDPETLLEQRKAVGDMIETLVQVLGGEPPANGS
jgi:Glycoside hydrolase 123, catalytic domain/Carbohydrate family 9 binding domain-like/Glycoside hydrolase 123 N-terminal domain